MRAPVQVSMHSTLEADSKCAAGLARVIDVERHGAARIQQIAAVAK